MYDNIGIELQAWYNGRLTPVALRRERDLRGRFENFVFKDEYPAVLLENGEFGVVRQDQDAKLYFLTY